MELLGQLFPLQCKLQLQPALIHLRELHCCGRWPKCYRQVGQSKLEGLALRVGPVKTVGCKALSSLQGSERPLPVCL